VFLLSPYVLEVCIVSPIYNSYMAVQRLQQSAEHLIEMPSVAELSEICIPMVNEVAYKKRKLKVVTIGAGFSGLVFAHKIQHEQPELQDFIDHTIYEANDDIGGTWKNNTYPGVQCDVPSHIYVSRCKHKCVTCSHI
jgi:hypothetical protein